MIHLFNRRSFICTSNTSKPIPNDSTIMKTLTDSPFWQVVVMTSFCCESKISQRNVAANRPQFRLVAFLYFILRLYFVFLFLFYSFPTWFLIFFHKVGITFWVRKFHSVALFLLVGACKQVNGRIDRFKCRGGSESVEMKRDWWNGSVGQLRSVV